MSDRALPFLAFICGFGGLLMALWPRQSIENARRMHDQKLADRLARGHDAFFEELRMLQSYPPPQSVVKRRLLGLLLVVLGLGALVLYFTFLRP